MVPWSYHCNYVNESATVNISGIGGMTWSGKCYEPAIVETIPLNLVKELPKSRKSETNADLINEPITKKDASEFLKFI